MLIVLIVISQEQTYSEVNIISTRVSFNSIPNSVYLIFISRVSLKEVHITCVPPIFVLVRAMDRKRETN